MTNKKKAKSKLKVGDLVKVITGNFRGTIDHIFQINSIKEIVFLKKITRKGFTESQKKEKFIPIHISNVKYWEEKI